MTPEQIAKLPYRPCVGVVLVNREGKVFVGQRAETTEPAWQMPQGGVDDGETAHDAALRELWEETGVNPALVTIVAQTSGWIPYDLPYDVVVHKWKGKFRGQEQKWFLMRFNGTDDQVNIQTTHPEFSEWKWVTPTEVVAAIVPFKRAVYEQVMAELVPHI